MHGQLVPRGQHHFAQSISYIDVNIYFERHHFSFHRGHILCLVDWWLGKLKDGRVVLGPTAMLFLLLSLISIAFAAAAVPAPTQSSTQSQCEVALAAACAGSRGNAFTCATCAGKQHMKLQQAGCDNNMISRWCAGLPASEASVRAGSWNVYYKALDDPAGQRRNLRQ
jgi:hypothetical protein